jgi:casein kinase 1
MLSDKYKFIKRIGEGGFASIYWILNLYNNKHYIAKVEDNIKNKLLNEYKIYKKLQDVKGIIQVYEYIETDQYNLLIMEKMDNDLEVEFINNNNYFDYSYILFFGIRALKILEQIHNRGIIHRDIKPHNFLLKNKIIYLSDFGLSSKTKPDNNKFTGSLKYSSINNHLRVQATAKDDIESLFYVILFFLNGGQLPWTKYDNISEIKYKKMQIDYNNYIPEYPNLIEFIKYIRELRNDDINYSYLIHLLIKN